MAVFEFKGDAVYRKGWNDAIAKATEIAGNVHLHTAGVTQERDMAHKILPRVAIAVALLKLEDTCAKT